MPVLNDIRQAVDAAISKGETWEDFRKHFAQIVKSRGWFGGAGVTETGTKELLNNPDFELPHGDPEGLS